MFIPWIILATDATLLAMESQNVIWNRLSHIATGRGTAEENLLMVTEKIEALAEAAVTLAAGGSPHSVVQSYRKTVHANAERLCL